MIKFFRNIRQNLISEGKTTKYLKYAIGEIVLVVIGILIALQINNWNQDRHQLQREKKILMELKRDLVSNDSILQVEIKTQRKMVVEAGIVIAYLKSKRPYNDSIGFFLNRLAFLERIQFFSSAYESLKSVGIDIISSDHLRANIVNIFGNRFPFTTIWLRDTGMVHADLMLPLLTKFSELITPYNSFKDVKFAIDYDNLLKSQELINVLSKKKGLKIEISKSLEQLQNSVRKTINDIESELEHF